MKCEKCGFENLDNATFCIKCGNRLDGKILCPKCGEYIPNDASFCPNCGKEIPHQSVSETIKQDAIDSKKSKIAEIFNKVSLFVCLGFFIISILMLFVNTLDRRDVILKPDFFTYIIDAFKDFSSLSSTGKSLTIIRAAIVAINISVVLFFSILGLLKVVKNIKDKSHISDIYKYVVVVLTSQILTNGLLLSTGAFKDIPDVSSAFGLYVGFAFVHLTTCLAFDCFLNFKRGQISIFIARIILSLSLLGMLIMIASFNQLYISANDIKEGMVNHLVKVIDLFNNTEKSALSISLLLMMLATVSFAFIFVMCAYSTSTYLASSYFKGMNRFKRFRIIYYMSSITLSILATALLISSIAEMVLYTKFVGDENISIHLTGFIALIVIISFLLIGGTIATFNIYSKYSHHKALEQKTTKVE